MSTRSPTGAEAVGRHRNQTTLRPSNSPLLASTPSDIVLNLYVILISRLNLNLI